MNERTLMEMAAGEIGHVLGALLDAAVQVVPAAEAPAVSTIVHLTLGGPIGGSLAVGLPEADVTALARLVMMLDEDPPPSAADDALQEVCSQAIGALSQRADFSGLRVSQARIDPAAPAGTPTAFRVTAGERFNGSLVMWAATVAETRMPTPPPPGVEIAAPAPRNLDVILDIELPLSVRFGETEMTLLELARLAPGSVVDLGRAPDDPVDVLVNGRLVARGEVVAVAGNYGVRITEIISAAERLRTMTA